MTRCPECGTEALDGAVRCAGCGEVLGGLLTADKGHALKQALFGGALVVGGSAGAILMSLEGDRWLGFLPPWLVLVPSVPILLKVTLGWIRIYSSPEPVLRLEPGGLWSPGSGMVPWNHVRAVKSGNGVIHIRLWSREHRSSDQPKSRTRPTVPRPRDAWVGPIALGAAAHEVAAVIRERAGLPARQAAVSIADLPWRQRIVIAFIVGTLTAVADLMLSDLAGSVIWLAGLGVFIVLDWLARSWLLQKVSGRPGAF